MLTTGYYIRVGSHLVISFAYRKPVHVLLWVHVSSVMMEEGFLIFFTEARSQHEMEFGQLSPLEETTSNEVRQNPVSVRFKTY